ncbi:MAG: hypothetical protein QOJ58_1005, partial [Alphaproteobacteria bacterium]|nr:hypothetical protein [Alphaproteobacteria bacterium]
MLTDRVVALHAQAGSREDRAAISFSAVDQIFKSR